MKNIFIDTNILIDYSKGYGFKLTPLLKKQEEKLVYLYISTIIIIEYMNDFNLIDKEKISLAEKFLQNFTLIDINKKIAYITASLLRTQQISYIGDALIAATCLNNGLELMTNNQKDFKKVKGLKFFSLDNKRF